MKPFVAPADWWIGVRAVYALWPPKEDQAKSVCETLGIEYVRGLVVSGGVVKANGRANLRVTVFVRDGRGLLCDRSAELAVTKLDESQLLPGLCLAIADAARDGKPYTKTGVNGVYERRFELPEAFHAIGKHRLVGMVEALLSSRQLVQAMADNSKSVKWLDAPDGRIAGGDPHFVGGHIKRSAATGPNTTPDLETDHA